MQKIDLEKFYVIEREKLCWLLLVTGLTLAYYSTLYPWFLWPLSYHATNIAGFLLIGSMFVRPKVTSILTRKDFLLPAIFYVALDLYENFSTSSNILGFGAIVFRAPIFVALFILGTQNLPKFMHFLTKSMAVLQIISLAGYFMYLSGIPLPSKNVSFDNEFYYYTNYYFFLLDDRAIFDLVPRFESFFIEPNYLGTACALLLFYQVGNWRKWYCVVLLVSALLSFSLSAYVLLVVIVFLNLWRQGKKIAKRLFATLLFLSLVIGGSFVYNKGDNLVHNLILLRLEIEDGELAGNNRITSNFKTEYENYLKSSDIVFGRDRDLSEFGNSGYQVYVYEHGIVGVLLLFGLYLTATYRADNKRNLLSGLFLAALIFGVNGYITWYQIFIPIYCAIYANSQSP